VAASALLCGRRQAVASDLWVFRHLWDSPEQQEVIAAIVNRTLEASEGRESQAGHEPHPRARPHQPPQPEALAEAIEAIRGQVDRGQTSEVERSYLRDRLSVLSARCQWVVDDTQRSYLIDLCQELSRSLQRG
jgi:MoxR-like ATPase